MYFNEEIKYGLVDVMEEDDVNERRANDRFEDVYQAVLNDNKAV